MRWVLALWFWIGAASADPIVVFAAASLKDPLDSLTQGTDVVVSYAGSGTIARQVIQGAPADVVLVANAQWMAEIQKNVAAENVADFASNTLVLIAPAGADPINLEQGLAAQLQDGPLALGFTTAVPAGIYAREALTVLGLWGDVSGKVAEVDNVRAVVALVARGEAPLGIVYETDVIGRDTIDVVARFPRQRIRKFDTWAGL